MLRKLFALLLLLTGLAALGQPAQARAFEAEGTGLAAAADYTCPAETHSAAQLSAPAQSAQPRPGLSGPARSSSLAVPAVRMQADRAHE